MCIYLNATPTTKTIQPLQYIEKIRHEFLREKSCSRCNVRHKTLHKTYLYNAISGTSAGIQTVQRKTLDALQCRNTKLFYIVANLQRHDLLAHVGSDDRVHPAAFRHGHEGLPDSRAQAEYVGAKRFCCHQTRTNTTRESCCLYFFHRYVHLREPRLDFQPKNFLSSESSPTKHFQKPDKAATARVSANTVKAINAFVRYTLVSWVDRQRHS